MIDQGQDQDPMRRRGIEREGEVTQMRESIIVEAKNDKVQLTIQISKWFLIITIPLTRCLSLWFQLSASIYETNFNL